MTMPAAVTELTRTLWGRMVWAGHPRPLFAALSSGLRLNLRHITQLTVGCGQ
jgi:hypothetical protein